MQTGAARRGPSQVDVQHQFAVCTVQYCTASACPLNDLLSSQLLGCWGRVGFHLTHHNSRNEGCIGGCGES